MSGNADDFDYGAMLRDQAELRAATEYEEVTRQGYGKDKKRAEQFAKALRSAAAQEREGAVVEVKDTGSRGNANWTIIVSRPKGRK